MSPDRRLLHPITGILLVALLIPGIALLGSVQEKPASIVEAQFTPEPPPVHLPVVARSYPWQSPFGVQIAREMGTFLQNRARDLGIKWVRLQRVSWRDIQPIEGGPYDWSVLSSFEDELRASRVAGFTPIVVVHHSPRWATTNEPFETDCGAIRADKFPAFASFMQAVVNRYSQPEFGVRYWELGNEPDVDPSLVEPDKQFGCWGDIDDPYYGGRHYGNMLKVVTPAIKAANPDAQVLIGGLLLATPDTTDPNLGKPELFLRGILQAGAAPYFDILPYHAYTLYVGEQVDYDNSVWSASWYPWGGWTVGKARYLRQTMADYGVDKPLVINEIALGCRDDFTECDPPSPEFYEAQADYVVRTFTRDLAEGIQVLQWYTLEGPGWREGGLLNADGSPRPSYVAYQQLVTRLQDSEFGQKVSYSANIEAYSFQSGSEVVHVVWSIDASPDTVLVPSRVS